LEWANLIQRRGAEIRGETQRKGILGGNLWEGAAGRNKDRKIVDRKIGLLFIFLSLMFLSAFHVLW
jgi:hypothetical protein